MYTEARNVLIKLVLAYSVMRNDLSPQGQLQCTWNDIDIQHN